MKSGSNWWNNFVDKKSGFTLWMSTLVCLFAK